MRHRSLQFSPVLLVLLSLPFVVSILTFAALRTRSPFIFGMIWVVPMLILLLNRLDLWLIAIMWLNMSRMRVPGLGGELAMVDVLVAGLVAVVFARYIVRKRGVARDSIMWALLIVFAGILLFLMWKRGTGMRMLGDSQWGGMRYVGMFIAIGFAFAIGHVRLTSRQWQVALVGMTCIALLPFLADAVFILSKGRIWQQFMFFRHGGVEDAFERIVGTAMTRFKSGGNAAYALVMLPALMFRYCHKGFVIKSVPFLLAAAVLAGYSGHRIAILSCGLFVWLYLFFHMRDRLSLFFGLTALGGIACFVMIYGAAPYLPLSAQRSLSFIPLIPFDAAAVDSAQGTVDWRVTVWQKAVDYHLPQYWLLGKGLAYDGEWAMFVMQHYKSADAHIEWALVNSTYHNGPLSLLILTGVPGLVVGLAVLLVACWRHYRIATGPWASELLQRLHLPIFITVLILVMRYILIYGDMQTNIPEIILLVAILEGLYLTNLQLELEDAGIPEADRASAMAVRFGRGAAPENALGGLRRLPAHRV